MQLEHPAAALGNPAAAVHAGSWRQALRHALRLYVAHVTVLIVLAAAVSSQYPRTPIEQQIAVWPPSAPITTWLDRVVLRSIERYDVYWYMGIAESGYGIKVGDTAFHPLYPLLGGAVGRLLGAHYGLGLWLVSQVCCVAMLVMFYRLVHREYDLPTAGRATLLLMCSPLGFAFLLPYTESLLLLSILGAVLAAGHGRWLLAGCCGAAAVLTKQPGAIVVLPMLYELWQREGANLRAGRVRGTLHGLAGVALIPLGLAGWLVYRATLGDVAFDWSQPQTMITAVLVTPSYSDVWGLSFNWPWVNAGYAFSQAIQRPNLYNAINVLVLVTILVMIGFVIWRQRDGAAIFAVVITLLSLSTIPPTLIFVAIRRFTIIYPIFIQLALWTRRRTVLLLIVAIQGTLWLLIGTLYVRHAFVL